MTPTEQFILDHSEDNVHILALQAMRYPAVDMSFVVRQIAGRQKIKQKIPSFYNLVNIQYPKQLSLEQSSSETTALYKAQLCKGNTFTDLTGGFGVDSAFMAAKFTQASYVERQKELCEITAHNFEVLGLKHIRIFNQDAIEFLQEMEPVDMIYIDPARRSEAGKKVIKLSDCEPDVSIYSPQLLSKAKNVLIKLSPMLDITQIEKELQHIREIHIVSVNNECKELLVLLEEDYEAEIQIKTINFKNNSAQEFSFISTEESTATTVFASEAGKYLYEPNSSLMKAGAFKLTGLNFGMQKLHIHTHLYTSDTLEENFPGRIFEIKEIIGNSKQELKTLKNRIKKANIAIRNYPESVEELRKKTGIQEGGEEYIFACKMHNEKYWLLLCKKVYAV